MHKYLTIEDLLNFCQQSNMDKFSAKDADGPIIVQSFGKIKTEDTTNIGLTPCTLMACHTELNRNQSFIAEDVMNAALASFSNRPILGYTHQLEDGTWNFWDHRMAVQEEEDGETRIEYLERPIGVVPESCNAHIAYDEEHDKNYVVVNGYIYDDYGNKALDIIKENDGQVDVSVEIAINSMSYNAKENHLNIEDFTFMGVTCLGKTPDGETVRPGMEGANLKLDNFSATQNSMFAADCQDKLIETLEKLNETLLRFNTCQSKEEGGNEAMDDFENEIVEEVVETEVEETEVVEETETETEEITTSEEVVEEQEEEVQEEKFTKSFSVELSHDDIRYALYNLIGVYEEEDNDWYYIRDVYDDYFYMQSWSANKLYKVGYSVDGENVTLEGDRQEMFEIIVSESEKMAIDKMREEYSALVEFKANIEAAELKAQKDAIFAKSEYSILVDEEAFKTLVNDAEKFSVDEIESKVKSIFADHVIKMGTFSKKEDDKKEVKTIGFNFSAKGKKSGPYGNLFSDRD